jgi:hypothetical protein
MEERLSPSDVPGGSETEMTLRQSRATALRVGEEHDATSGILTQLDQLRARIEAIEARHGVRDAWERAVPPAIAAAIGGRR